MSTTVTTTTSTSSKTGSNLYEEIPDAVVAKISNFGLNKKITVPEAVHLVTTQIVIDQGTTAANLDKDKLAEEVAKQVIRIRKADTSILPILTDLYKAAANGLKDSLDLLKADHSMPKAVALLVHKLAIDANSTHTMPEAAV